ncbi:MAG TPA: DUF3291 domain-containing protein [Actinophytocola sp.]|uniref:DUF3291 domain-containing protein n=1 Tax=Actinophytocola sp. TaxID=1872138 RepID=UPI002F944754
MGFHLAQANLSLLRLPPSAPQVAEYVSALARINALADRAPGFVWRLREPVSADERLVLNLSLWTSYRPLHEYTYRSAHGHFVRRRHEWFEPVTQPSTVLWWVPAGSRPTVEEGLARLRRLRRYGPAPEAFSVRVRFDPAGHRERR